MKRFALILFGIIVILFFSFAAYAGAPLEKLRKDVTDVLNVLKDPARKAEFAKDIKSDKILPIYATMFDDVELSKRALARNWNNLSVPQRQEFVKLFRQVLERAYGDKIVSYNDEKVLFDRETMLSANIAEIQSRVVTASKEIPVNYMMIQKNGVWKVYDVIVENVSLVQNYRTQFNEILAKNTTDQLLEILRKKIKEK
ncbi:MAG: ABC transporter substrate-binding protein [Syntrophales bacterium]|jgi:phospholipid transport system substrate-binding protein|nr:ABC transporter substrate-binding protein [Syntrophales bacterium]